MSSVPPPPAPVETVAFLEIRNASKSCMVEVNPQEVVKIGDLSSWKLIKPFFDEDQLLPPLHRIQWLVCAKEGGAGSEGQGGEGDTDDGSGDGCSNYCPNGGDEEEPAAEQSTRVAANEELIDYDACCAYQFVITSVEPVVNLKRLPGERVTAYIRRVRGILSRGMELNDARSFLYDQGWLVLFEEWPDLVRSEVFSLPPQPFSAEEWGLARSRLELPDAEAEKHCRAAGDAAFTSFQRDLYARTVLEMVFFAIPWLSIHPLHPDFVVACQLAAKSVDVGASELAGQFNTFVKRRDFPTPDLPSFGTSGNDDFSFSGVLSDVVPLVVRTLLDALKAKGETEQFSSWLQENIGFEEVSRHWKAFAPTNLSADHLLVSIVLCMVC